MQDLPGQNKGESVTNAAAAARNRRHSPLPSSIGSLSSENVPRAAATAASAGFPKKRSRDSSASPAIPDALLQSAVAQASQVCSKLGYHGLAQLLMQRSNASVSAGSSSAPASAMGAPNPGRLSPASATNQMLPSIAQVQQCATKAHQDQPPWIHWSKTDTATSLRVNALHRLELEANLTNRGGAANSSGYRMARANVGCSSGSYYFELWILEPPPSTLDVIQSLSPSVRLAPGLRKSLQAALEYEESQQKQPPPQQQHSKQQKPVSSVASAPSAHAAKPEGAATDEASDPGGEPTAKRARTDAVSSVAANCQLTSQESFTLSEEPLRRVGGHVRVGWSMRTGELQAPVGYDRWSFAIRDIGGSIVTNSQRIDNWVGSEGFGPGDVIGCSISLYNDDEKKDVENANHIRFFKNGSCMGEFVIAKGKRSGGEAPFPCPIPPGTYYPAVSCYLGGSVRANFGPKFVYPPRKLPAGLKLSPLSDLSPAPETDPQTVMAQMSPILKMLRNGGGQKNADYFAQVLQQSVQTEARILKEIFSNYQQQNLVEIRQERLGRGLAVQDLDTLLEEQKGEKSTQAESQALEPCDV